MEKEKNINHKLEQQPLSQEEFFSVDLNTGRPVCANFILLFIKEGKLDLLSIFNRQKIWFRQMYKDNKDIVDDLTSRITNIYKQGDALYDNVNNDSGLQQMLYEVYVISCRYASPNTILR